MIYGLQGALMWFISIPLQWIAISQRFNVLSYFGAILVACGIFFEATGDFQLTSFLNDETNKGKTLSTGLWRYTRHPNYFGDAVTWTGFFALAVSAPWGYLTALSPLLMWWLLTSLSGKPMLEKKLSSTREGYKAYIENTSSFIPRRPRRS
jgi:steroid 5-alpha reductase family enzyme